VYPHFGGYDSGMTTTDERFIATPHWQHEDWTVYDQRTDGYRLRGLTEIEALEQADALNRQERAR